MRARGHAHRERRADVAELRFEVAVAVEYLDALVAGVEHVDVALRVHGDRLRPVELSLLGAGRPPLPNEVAVAGELRDAVHVARHAIGNVDVAGLVPGDVRRAVERRARRARSGRSGWRAAAAATTACCRRCTSCRSGGGACRVRPAPPARRTLPGAPPRPAPAQAQRRPAVGRAGRRSLRAYVRAQAPRALRCRTSPPDWRPRRSSRRCPADRPAARRRR